jgi:hypothetical protein
MALYCLKVLIESGDRLPERWIPLRVGRVS